MLIKSKNVQNQILYKKERATATIFSRLSGLVNDKRVEQQMVVPSAPSVRAKFSYKYIRPILFLPFFYTISIARCYRIEEHEYYLYVLLTIFSKKSKSAKMMEDGKNQPSGTQGLVQVSGSRANDQRTLFSYFIVALRV